ncbi:PREDICTED: chymotrypsin-1-like [Ceratosolen solmsi marchali]|uniref:Chymotrypsin-1-like n=1 Tax=Ceratosolen solmsi marchali TaxID=326594 RepID=A0AAJ7E1R3_9HYME|nr:PREDICTED: chymotrypsin-1-like [Ceratosolen solmsi marchali]
MKMKHQIDVFVFVLLTMGTSAKNVRIVGGQDADVRTYPFVAVFKHVGQLHFFCGGAIISNRHVVTSAICLRKELNDFRHLRVYTGISSDPNTGTSHEVKKILIHPRFSATRNSDEMFLHDIAVVKLKQAIQFNEFQSAIELLNRDVISTEMGLVLGWGSTTYPEDSYPIQMQKANAHVIPESMNSRIYTFIMHDTQFAALDRNGIGLCTNDGGDPFIIEGKLAGLASIIYRCARGVPDVYTKIYYYIDFIRDMMLIS